MIEEETLRAGSGETSFSCNRLLGPFHDALTTNFIKNESFKHNLERTESAYLLSPNWELALQKTGLEAEGSPSHSTS